uniref:Uncharacterized protein n=2 Tax=Cacopsylla melanoneura TaxID=428564 RepID=A0A8D8RHR2_9HEMI
MFSCIGSMLLSATDPCTTLGTLLSRTSPLCSTSGETAPTCLLVLWTALGRTSLLCSASGETVPTCLLVLFTTSVTSSNSLYPSSVNSSRSSISSLHDSLVAVTYVPLLAILRILFLSLMIAILGSGVVVALPKLDLAIASATRFSMAFLLRSTLFERNIVRLILCKEPLQSSNLV